MHAPVLVLNDSMKRESGRKVHHANIQASKAMADIIRTTLGPRSMLKMLLDARGGIVLTNDGNAILRELDVAHMAVKTMIELNRMQDKEVEDGTTSVIILVGEFLHIAKQFLDQGFHPTVICRAYNSALEHASAALDEVAFKINRDDKQMMLNIVQSCIGTKFTSRFGILIADLAISSVKMIVVDLGFVKYHKKQRKRREPSFFHWRACGSSNQDNPQNVLVIPSQRYTSTICTGVLLN